ncbi:MAG: OmpA family protein [Novosphingobium sp.]|nr:MAG: OmpA family protein [Novosphingobium sp.]
MRQGGIIVGLLLTSACAAPQTLLLPGEDGHGVGALAVLEADGQEQVKTIKPAYRQLMNGLPPPSRSYTLYFVDGATNLVPESRTVLDQIRADVAVRPGAEVQVTGHTDTVGSEEANDRLSLERAKQVMSVLAAEGFSPDALSAVGRGEREPAVETGDNVANAQNRRVEVIVR